MSLQTQIAAAYNRVVAAINAVNAKTLPTGGVAGQVLTKSSNTNYAAQWITPSFAAVLTNDLVATTENVVASFAIPANSLVAGDKLDLKLQGQVSSTATTVYRIRFGPTGTATDALLCQFGTSAAGVANAHHFLDALISILSATTATAVGHSQLASAAVGITTAAFSAAAINLTVANFITVTLVQSIAQTYTSRAASLKK